MRLIDADALIKTLGIADDCKDCPYQSYNFCGRGNDFVVACEAITDAPIIDPVKWIPCKERLPEANGRYLVTRGLNACGALWNRVYIANYSDLMGIKSEQIWWQGNVGKSDFERLDDVMAWMPLPMPWKGGENEV